MISGPRNFNEDDYRGTKMEKNEPVLRGTWIGVANILTRTCRLTSGSINIDMSAG